MKAPENNEKEQKNKGISALFGVNLGISGVKFVVDNQTAKWRR